MPRVNGISFDGRRLRIGIRTFITFVLYIGKQCSLEAGIGRYGFYISRQGSGLITPRATGV